MSVCVRERIGSDFTYARHRSDLPRMISESDLHIRVPLEMCVVFNNERLF